MVQFEAIDLSTAKLHLTQKRPRRQLTDQQEAARVSKMKATMARKRAERDAAASTRLNARVSTLESMLDRARKHGEELQGKLEEAYRSATRQADNFAALQSMEHEAREQLHIFMESTRRLTAQVEHYQSRVTNLTIQRSTIERQRDALQSIVMIHGNRNGALSGVLALLLSALEVENDDQGHCVWCRQSRLGEEDAGTEPHTERCPIGRALQIVQ